MKVCAALPLILLGLPGCDAFAPLPAHTSVVASKSETSLLMGLTLYGSPGSRSPLVNWAAYELGLELERGDLAKNPHPFGQMPCLADDNDVTIFESGAILLYLLEKASPDLTQSQKGQVMSWVSWANASLDPICFLETPDGKVYDTGLKKPNRRIDTLDGILANQDFLVKGVFTIADVAVASYVAYVLQFFPGVDISRWPNVVRHVKDCVARDAYSQAFGPNVQAFLTKALNEMGQAEEEPKKLFGMF